MGIELDKLIQSVGVGEDGVSRAYPDTFLEDIGAAATADAGSADAMIQTVLAEKAALEAELLAAKAHNYELIMQIPRPEAEASSEEDDADADADADSDDDDDEIFDKPDDK